MERVAVVIEGTTPLLIDAFTDADAIQVEGGGGAVFKGQQETPRNQAQARLYKDERGSMFIPGPNLFRAIIDAGAFHKLGRKQVTTGTSSLVPAAMSLIELNCPITNRRDKEATWEVDSRSIVIQKTLRRMKHRPRFDEWRIGFTVEVDTTIFPLQLARLLVDDAGKRIGLGSFRPARKGPFGRFQVIRWENEKQTKAAA